MRNPAAALDTNAAMLALGNETLNTPLATMVRNRDLPNIYAANHVVAISASTAEEVDEMMARTEAEYQHARHRRFHVDYRTPPEVVARLTLEGYIREDILAFLLDGPLRGSPRTQDIRPVVTNEDWEAFWDLMRLDWNESHQRKGEPPDESVSRRMWEATRMKQPPMQYWMAYVAERPVAYFGSWGGIDGVGQVEDLFTHPAHRHRGIAKSLIFHCVDQSRLSGASRVVITADPTDTPKDIYASLGFHPVAVVSQYLKRLDD